MNSDLYIAQERLLDKIDQLARAEQKIKALIKAGDYMAKLHRITALDGSAADLIIKDWEKAKNE